MDLKEKFFTNIEPYISNGVLKEIYSNDEFCIMNFGELFYIGCLYNGIDGIPFGTMIAAQDIKKVVENNVLFFMYLKEMGKEGFYKRSISLEKENLNKAISYIERKKQSGATSIVDHALEEEIMNMNKSKGK